MGQKIHPTGLRIGINKNWESRWFPKFNKMPEQIAEDDAIRKFLKKQLYYAGISHIIIERTFNNLRITVFAARTGYYYW